MKALRIVLGMLLLLHASTQLHAQTSDASAGTLSLKMSRVGKTHQNQCRRIAATVECLLMRIIPHILDYGVQSRHPRLRKWVIASGQVMSRPAWAACIAIVSLMLFWPASYFRGYAIGYVAESESEPSYFLYLDAGRFKWCEYQGGDMPEGLHVESRPHPYAESWASWSYGQKDRESVQFWSWEFAGLSYFVPVPPRRPMYPWRVITVPFSLCTVCMGIVPFASVLTHRRKRERNRMGAQARISE